MGRKAAGHLRVEDDVARGGEVIAALQTETLVLCKRALGTPQAPPRSHDLYRMTELQIATSVFANVSQA